MWEGVQNILPRGDDAAHSKMGDVKGSPGKVVTMPVYVWMGLGDTYRRSPATKGRGTW